MDEVRTGTITKQLQSPCKDRPSNFNFENCSATHYANISSSMYETSNNLQYKQLNIQHLQMDSSVSPPLNQYPAR